MTDYQRAANVIASFEGFAPHAEWDVNHFRLGFGSDTEGPEQREVVKGMTTTRARALQNLALRIPAYEAKIVEQVTPASWAALTNNEQAALLSFAYNYGALTSSVARCVREQYGCRAIAAAIEAREDDNGGVNARRRQLEALLVLSTEGVARPAARDADAAPVQPGVVSPNPPPGPSSKEFVEPRDPITIDVGTPAGVQKALNVFLPPGATKLAVDGVIGPKTRAMIRDWQAWRGLPVNGLVDQATTNSLHAALTGR